MNYSIFYFLYSIVGLDPAGPLYDGPIKTQKELSKTDAVFVLIVHSDAGIFGYPTSTGTVDFWPNGGRSLQPGCDSISPPGNGMKYKKKNRKKNF